jgi:hypothetical protein
MLLWWEEGALLKMDRGKVPEEGDSGEAGPIPNFEF